jgi:hypothetical protein
MALWVGLGTDMVDWRMEDGGWRMGDGGDDGGGHMGDYLDGPSRGFNQVRSDPYLYKYFHSRLRSTF